MRNYFSSADFMDDEYIRELLQWTHPHIANKESVQYTEEENLQLLSLPKKECLSFRLLFEIKLTDASQTSRHHHKLTAST